ncbi:hypothetical protein E4U10_007234 [Claviceps purpurea]|nr:hypothetical protein E4U10_007234 [Claviceps purpurea]
MVDRKSYQDKLLKKDRRQGIAYRDLKKFLKKEFNIASMSLSQLFVGGTSRSLGLSDRGNRNGRNKM